MSTDPGSSRPDPLDRQRVIAIACDLVDTEGVDALTLTRVADIVDVTQPALYRHVDSINDLWRGVGLAARDELARRCAEACVGLAGPEAVRAVAAAWRSFAQDHPGQYRSTDRVAVAGDAELEEAVRRVVEILSLALRGYRMTEVEIIHGARTLRSALHGFCSFEISDGHPAPPDPNASFDHMIDLLCLAFEQTSPPATAPASTPTEGS